MAAEQCGHLSCSWQWRVDTWNVRCDHKHTSQAVCVPCSERATELLCSNLGHLLTPVIQKGCLNPNHSIAMFLAGSIKPCLTNTGLRWSTEPLSPTITSSRSYVIWYEKPPFKATIGDNLTTIKGRKVTIVCPATGIPHPAIAWYRAGERIHNDERHKVTGYELIINKLDALDTDRYTCVAKNMAGMATATSTLKVHGECLIYLSQFTWSRCLGYNCRWKHKVHSSMWV